MKFQVPTFFIGFVFIFNLQGTVFSSHQKMKLKYCFVDDSLHSELMKPAGSCPILDDLDHEKIECIIATDRATCLRYLIDNQTDFMIAEPEDLLILAMHNKFNDHILVTSEIKEYEEAKSKDSMVVLVQEGLVHLSQTKKKRFCSPGFDPNFLSQDFVKYFENKIIPRQCDPEKTVLENRMSGLSEYFGTGCVSGSWTLDSKLDVQLKNNYSSLCSWCQVPNSCSSSDAFYGKAGALRCFFEYSGDVAWTSLNFVANRFGPLQNRRRKFHYLCPNGTATDEPCIWLDVPWKTVISKADSARKVMAFIKNNFYFKDVMRLFIHKTYELDEFKTPIGYLQDSFPEYLSTKDHAKCRADRTVKWCVVTKLETEKCKWISHSAQTHELEPLIECVQEISKEKCIKSVRNGWTDIFSIKPQLLSEAKKGGLKPLLHMIGNEAVGMSETAALVHKSSNITSLKDLKNAKACFGYYADYGWNTFIYLMKNMTGDKDWICKDKKMFSEYFKESCVNELSEKNFTFPRNLYSLCFKISENVGNESFSCSRATKARRESTEQQLKFSEIPECNTVDEAMLSCLTQHDADVAFVNLSSMYQHSSQPWGKHYKLLCLNGSISNDNESKMCFASWRNYGSLMVHENLTQTRKNEIYLLMKELDRFFGEVEGQTHRPISLYGPFGGESSVIFPEEAMFLEEKDCTLRCSLDYEEMIKYLSINEKFCSGFSSLASLPRNHFTTYLFVFILLLMIITITSYILYIKYK